MKFSLSFSLGKNFRAHRLCFLWLFFYEDGSFFLRRLLQGEKETLGFLFPLAPNTFLFDSRCKIKRVWQIRFLFILYGISRHTSKLLCLTIVWRQKSIVFRSATLRFLWKQGGAELQRQLTGTFSMLSWNNLTKEFTKGSTFRIIGSSATESFGESNPHLTGAELTTSVRKNFSPHEDSSVCWNCLILEN